MVEFDRAPSSGPSSNVVSGGISCSHNHVCGVSSVLPYGSTARTENVCGPSPSVRICGEEQVAQSAASSRHWKVALPSGEEKSKRACVPIVSTAGWESRFVAGAVASTVQVLLAVGPTFPYVSMPRTSNLHGPSVVADMGHGLEHVPIAGATSLVRHARHWNEAPASALKENEWPPGPTVAPWAGPPDSDVVGCPDRTKTAVTLTKR